MDIKHEMLVELATVVQDLGAVPTRDLWRTQYKQFSVERITAEFGSFGAFLAAAGYSVGNGARGERRRKIAEAFTAQIDEIIDGDSRETKTHRLGFAPTDVGIAIPDTHFPWEDKRTIRAVIERIKKEQPRWVCQLGDLHDMLAASKFPRSHVNINPAQEVSMAKKLAGEMWAEIRAAAPKAELIQIKGNHDIRPLRRILEAAPELEVFLELDRFYTFDGVRLISDPKDIVLAYDKLELTHGHWSTKGSYAAAHNRNVIHGHTHKLYAQGVRNLAGQQFLEVSAGFAGAYGSKAQDYRDKREHNVQHGFAIHRGPQEITLVGVGL